jgi:hypothetical protein
MGIEWLHNPSGSIGGRVCWLICGSLAEDVAVEYIGAGLLVEGRTAGRAGEHTKGRGREAA